MRTVEGLALALVKLLAGLQHTIHPGQKLAGGMVGMKDNGNVVSLSHGMHVHGPGNRTCDGGRLVVVG